MLRSCIGHAVRVVAGVHTVAVPMKRTGDADIAVAGNRVSDPRQFVARAGEEVVVGRISGGLRGYLAAGESPQVVSREGFT